jgi:hypothetical protein
MNKRRSSFPVAAFEYVRKHNAVFSDITGFNQLDRPVVMIDGNAEPSRLVEQGRIVPS